MADPLRPVPRLTGGALVAANLRAMFDHGDVVVAVRLPTPLGDARPLMAVAETMWPGCEIADVPGVTDFLVIVSRPGST